MSDVGIPHVAEKRAIRRFALQLPVLLQHPSSQTPVPGETRDVSSQGICFLTDASMSPGAEINFLMTLPPEITMTEAINVRCSARVLRVQGDQPGGKTAIAARIEKYEFVPPEQL